MTSSLPYLRSRSLEYNEIGAEGAAAVGKALEKNTTLKDLK